MIKLKYLGLLSFPIMLISACTEISTELYEGDRAMVNFNATLKEHSFAKTRNEIDTVSIPFYINGLAADHTRSMNFEIISDSTTAVEGEDFTVISAEVLPNEFSGDLKVRVRRPADPDSVDLRAYFRIVDGQDLVTGIGTQRDADLILTNRLTSPHRWNHEPDGSWKSKYFLGTYSTAYYKFIIEATGETEYPYPYVAPGYNNDETWTREYAGAFEVILEIALREYNESIAPDVLLHDDGPAAGYPVIVGKYYTFE